MFGFKGTAAIRVKIVKSFHIKQQLEPWNSSNIVNITKKLVGIRTLALYGVADAKRGLNQGLNCDLMVEAANQYDKQRPDAKHINHASGQDVLEGRYS